MHLQRGAWERNNKGQAYLNLREPQARRTCGPGAAAPPPAPAARQPQRCAAGTPPSRPAAARSGQSRSAAPPGGRPRRRAPPRRRPAWGQAGSRDTDGSRHNAEATAASQAECIGGRLSERAMHQRSRQGTRQHRALRRRRPTYVPLRWPLSSRQPFHTRPLTPSLPASLPRPPPSSLPPFPSSLPRPPPSCLRPSTHHEVHPEHLQQLLPQPPQLAAAVEQPQPQRL